MVSLANSITSQVKSYDKAVSDWLKCFPANDNGEAINVVNSTPDRAFAAMARLQHITKGMPENMPIRNIPLPFISAYRIAANFDPARNRGYGAVRVASADGSGKKMRHPMPYTLDYRIEMWAKNQQTLNVLQEYANLSFNYGFEQFITVPMVTDDQETSIQVPLVNSGITFSGVDEPEQGHRVLRQILSVQLKGWLYHPVESVSTVGEIIINYVDGNTGADLCSDTISPA